MVETEVTNADDLAAFIAGLADEVSSGRLDEMTLARYLEALSGWVDDMDGYFRNRGVEVPEQPSWSLIAAMLRAATVYE